MIARSALRASTLEATGEVPRHDAGFSVVMAVATILILLVLGLALVTLVTEDSDLSLNHVQSNQALYAAHAGIEYAIQKLSKNGNWTGLVAPGKAVGAGSFWIAPPDTIDEAGRPLRPGVRRIVSTGIVGRAKRVIQVLVAPGNIAAAAGGGDGRGLAGDRGPATSAALWNPGGVAVAANGDLYVADTGNHAIRRVEFLTGEISTVAGTGVAGSSGDGGPATAARLRSPEDVFVASNGDLYIADTGNHTIRRVVAATGAIARVVGCGRPGSGGDGGDATEAWLNAPHGIVMDPQGNLFIADTGNNRIRRVSTSTGIITTVAGSGSAGYSGDGGRAADARLRAPEDVALSAGGDLYVADTRNHAVRRVASGTAIITTVAGIGAPGYSGDGGAAVSAGLDAPESIDFGPDGDLYVADTGNHRIRRLDTATGTITTIAGCGASGGTGDGGPSTHARLDAPRSVAVSPAGPYYVADRSTHRVRKVTGILSVVDWLETRV